jgi:YafQ family addiction module toxin component
MTYSMFVSDACEKNVEKLCKKNNTLREILEKKMNEIIENPHHYKPLKYDLAGEKRVHIMKSFVLKFEVDEKNKVVKFIFFGHHDEAYRRIY